MILLIAFACTPIEPTKYGNGKYDTATESASDTGNNSTDTGSTTDTNTGDTNTGDTNTGDTNDTTDTSQPADPNAIEIFGLHFHQGNEHYFGNTAYTVDYGGGEMYSYSYLQFSNPQRWLVAQNGSENFGEAGLFSRFDWNIDGSGAVWLCQTTANASTASEAQNTPAANAFNTASGCAGGPWIHFEN